MEAETNLCSRCSVLVLPQEWPPPTASTLSEMEYLNSVGKAIPLRFTLHDTLPALAVLHQKSTNGCDFCGLMRCYLLEQAEKQLPDVWEEITRSEVGVSVIVDDMAYWYHQTLKKDPDGIGIGVRNRLLNLDAKVRVGEEGKCFRVHFTVCGADEESATEYLQIDARPSEETSFSPVNVNRMRSWLAECESTHEQCRITLEDRFVPTRLIDVSGGSEAGVRLCVTADEPTLSQADVPARYAALSYCWGDPVKYPPFKTYISNTSEHMRDIPLTKLPQTIRDAVAVTRTLGLRWIWVDAVCIIQDDNEDWQKEAARMMHVYGHAVITIAAVYGTHGHAGMFPHRKPAPSIAVPFEVPGDDTIKSKYFLEAEDRELYGSRPDIGYHDDVDIREWNERAWTYQERALSWRTLIFGQNMRFECQKIHHSSVTRDENGGQMPLRDSSVHLLKQPGESPYDFWIGAVEMYSGRKLTYATDRLVAISGIARTVAQHGGEKYLAGTWAGDLTRQLLWTSWGFEEPSTEFVAPSWSWACCSRRVRYIRSGEGQTATDAYKLVDAQIILAGNDDLGAVRAGSLKLSGQPRTFENMAHLESGCGNRLWPCLEDIVKRVGESEPVWALPLVRKSTVHATGEETFRQVQGLILCAHNGTSREETSVYTRVGFFLMDKTIGHDIECFDACRNQVVTIV